MLCDPTVLVKFRKLIGEDGVELLLSYTIAANQNMKFVSNTQMETVMVDSTVQYKAIAHRDLVPLKREDYPFIR